MALQHARTSHSLDVVIHTDSMTAIKALQASHTENPHLTHDIHTAAAAIQNDGRTVTINWVPSHVGIRGNDDADALARQGAHMPDITLHIPRTLRQMKSRVRNHQETRRVQERMATEMHSASRSWLATVTAGDEQDNTRGLSRRCEVVRARIRLGYPYGWEIGLATPEEKRRCRICAANDKHTLEHYLRECEPVRHLRDLCSVPSPTLTHLSPP